VLDKAVSEKSSDLLERMVLFPQDGIICCSVNLDKFGNQIIVEI
jgi:hypothetical protein